MLAYSDEERDLNWLKTMTQFAVQLEFATIPPYLTALWSIKDTTSSSAPVLLLPLILQEMLHMGLACNLLNSLGQTPVIADSNVVSRYPGYLPGGVHPTLLITLRPFSKALIADTFMPIEEPKSGPVTYALGETYPTIGAFYTAIEDCIRKLDKEIFSENKQLELVRPDFQLKPIKTAADAISAIHLIKSQGEGSSATPLYGPNPNDMSHYYIFGELYHEKLLVEVQKNVWHYVGDDLPFPAEGEIYSMAPIPSGGYPESEEFDKLYSTMLRQLQSAWAMGGSAGAAQLVAAQSTMGVLGQAAIQLMKTPIPNTNYTYGPSFRYIEAQP